MSMLPTNFKEFKEDETNEKYQKLLVPSHHTKSALGFIILSWDIPHLQICYYATQYGLENIFSATKYFSRTDFP